MFDGSLILRALLVLLVAGTFSAAKADECWVFIGTYTQGKSEGIYRCKLDTATGKLSEPELAGKTTNPSFLALHPNHKYLYAVTETSDYKGEKTGAVGAFALDAKTGELKPINQQPPEGGAPCHLVVDKKGQNVLVANYTGGNVAVLPIDEDGSLKPSSDIEQHKGASADPKRQKGPHAHSINLDKANRFAFAADLGLDKVLIYQYDAKAGKLTPNDPASVEIEAGAGPRHFAFHPSEKYAYVINEMRSTVTALKYDAEKGALKVLQNISTLPRGYDGNNSTAEVQVHPSGKLVFGSNRGHNSIVVFKVNEKTGELNYSSHQDKGIKVPRNFGIDPTGKYLLVASQAGDMVSVFKIDVEKGTLEPTGNEVKVPTPVCVKFLAVP